MAKSSRSKIKRKFRAAKRHKIKPKSVALLKKVISMPVGGTGLPYVDASKAELVEVVKKEEVVGAKISKNPPSLINEHGNYPIWMNKKEMRRHIGRRKRILRKKRKLSKK
ncbi:Learning associated protein 18 [Echinococcus multilocularis]|uniref:Learning associated protein 18 n=1 Tax=Echinococcus multilocularis TaxID=6211 RepID=A0A087VY91_ECHMU|nr:Learning associated protein 18 [Echinococcus multilocularis]